MCPITQTFDTEPNLEGRVDDVLLRIRPQFEANECVALEK